MRTKEKSFPRKIFGAFFKIKRKYSISKKYKITNWAYNPKEKKEYHINLQEEDGRKVFFMKQTNKEADSFEKLAKDIHKEQKVPKYTFRCFTCKNVFPIPFIGGNLLIGGKNNLKNKIQFICLPCKDIKK